ncbi:MAG: hypothetical protein RLZZ618_2493 [Pseudomonadota bacterium]|jgi:hypothetical protein
MAANVMAAERQGKTRPQQAEGSVPRLPHEHDESSDSQKQEAVRPEIKQAHRDVTRGLVDTDRGPPADAAYRRQKGGMPEGGPRK